jgi:LAO/AO transport system kinase
MSPEKGLADGVLAGSQRALARLATHVENGDEIGRAGLAKLYPSSGRAHIVGITGPPGAGKSTLINALVADLRRRERRVGVIAIDPTSPLSGGATLGDRIRMLDRQADPGVFIRSMASRRRAGGLAPATNGLIHLLDAAGFESILIETVGVGQDEIDVAGVAHTVVLVQVPATGDDVQLLKAGLLELADVFVVNKGDLAGAHELARGLRSLVRFGADRGRGWAPPIVPCVATSGTGIEAVADAIDAHRAYLCQGSGWQDRQTAIARNEIALEVEATVRRRLAVDFPRQAGCDDLVTRVADRTLTPFDAAARFLAELNRR